MTFKPLFGQITFLSLSFVTFRVSRFHVSYLTHETFKLRLQNTLNMLKMTRVYFGVLQYKPRTAIKGQILADFIMEFTLTASTEATQLTPDLPIWRLFMDGAANAQESGASLILTSPNGIDVDYALRFDFQAFNNEAEYEVVVAGLNLAHSMEADQLEVSSDS